MKIHPIRVDESSLADSRQLGKAIGLLRYDIQPLILRGLAAEIGRQACGDEMRGRYKLAMLLRRAHMQTEMLARTYDEILELCEPFMGDEFAQIPKQSS